jgi:hypothetical protein
MEYSGFEVFSVGCRTLPAQTAPAASTRTAQPNASCLLKRCYHFCYRMLITGSSRFRIGEGNVMTGKLAAEAVPDFGPLEVFSNVLEV